MNERLNNPQEFEGFFKRLTKRFKLSTNDEIKAWEMFFLGKNNREIFGKVAESKGHGKSHASGKFKEGKLKHS